ncbi:MAG: M23 family metallopeptidase [Vicinamibacterales bacterium]
MTSQRTVIARAVVAPVLVAVAIAVAARLQPGDAAAPAEPVIGPHDRPTPPALAPAPAAAGAPPVDRAPATLADRNLRLPIAAADVGAMKGQFDQPRDGGRRGHEAVDILAPRHTAVHAVDDGTIEKLFLSKAGGITIYQFDPTRRFAYYYAHLERYAPGLGERQAVSKGDILGYVGTSGNAPPDTPHLHFAIFELTPERQWWTGTPIDPWLAFRNEG